MYISVNNKCKLIECARNLVRSNSSSNFINPTLSVLTSIKKNLIKPGQNILEIGAGNLRNILFIADNIKGTKLYVYELEETINRFKYNYLRFVRKGGTIIKSFHNNRFDIIICTFVLETICPNLEREKMLTIIHDSLKNGGLFIASFRGYSGVRGKKYINCPLNEGLISPRKTFVKPYSLEEVSNFLKSSGFKDIQFMQRYKVNNPKNIHLIALK